VRCDSAVIDEFLAMFPSVDRQDAAEFLRLVQGDANTNTDRP
jgi:ribosomal 50S subunit-associated protein YjgA (DUF615 family)